MSKTNIELEDDEARAFLLWCKYYNIWKEIMDIRGGSAVIHFDLQGKMRKVEYTKSALVELSTFQ